MECHEDDAASPVVDGRLHEKRPQTIGPAMRGQTPSEMRGFWSGGVAAAGALNSLLGKQKKKKQEGSGSRVRFANSMTKWGVPGRIKMLPVNTVSSGAVR